MNLREDIEKELVVYDDFMTSYLKKEINYMKNQEWKPLFELGVNVALCELFDTDVILFADFGFNFDGEDFSKLKIMPFINEDEAFDYFTAIVEDYCEHRNTRTLSKNLICNDCGRWESTKEIIEHDDE